jgi:polyribonucleotide nucleotidyltransferase
VQNVKDVVKEGDKVFVKFMGTDERGKVRLSMKVVDQQTGQEIRQEPRQEPKGEAAA